MTEPDATTGQNSAPMTPAEQPVPVAPVSPLPQGVAPASKPKRSGCRGCFMGCLVTLGVFVLVMLIAAGWFFNWPVRWGLVASPAEKLFEPGVNPYAADALEEELAAQGINMQGVSVYVVPSDDGSGQVAYVLVDDQNGADWSPGGAYRSAAEGFLILTAGTQAADTYGIMRVAVDHRDEKGVQAAVVTAPTPVLREYAAGAITQQELFDQMDAYADMAGVLGGMSE